MNPNATIAQLYSLLTSADGHLDEKEMQMGHNLISIERLNEKLFNQELERIRTTMPEGLFEQCVSALKKLEQKVQVRYLAWMCVIANADGFMDKEEWSLIYRLYSKELCLPLNDIMAEQKILIELISKIARGAA